MKPFKFFRNANFIGNHQLPENVNLHGAVAVVCRTYEEWIIFASEVCSGLDTTFRRGFPGGLISYNDTLFFCVIEEKHVIGKRFDSFYIYGSYQNPEYQNDTFHHLISTLYFSIRR